MCERSSVFCSELVICQLMVQNCSANFVQRVSRFWGIEQLCNVAKATIVDLNYCINNIQCQCHVLIMIEHETFCHNSVILGKALLCT